MKKDFKDAIERLKEETRQMNISATYMENHKFNKEKEYILGKIMITSNIIAGLENVLNSTTKGKDIDFGLINI
jgi:hypothetical protein